MTNTNIGTTGGNISIGKATASSTIHVSGGISMGTSARHTGFTATQKSSYPSNSFLLTKKRRLLEIGKEYIVTYGEGKVRPAKFIRITPRGFNFVDTVTKKLLFKKHIYRCRNQDHDGYVAQTIKDDFWVWIAGWVNIALPFNEQEIDE